MYLSYNDYVSGGGALSESAFNKYIPKAEAIMDLYTFGRLCNSVINEKIKRCSIELVNILSKKTTITETYGGKIVQSQSNDGVSTTYVRPSYSEAVQSYDKEIADCINIYLIHEKDNEGTPLLYRGAKL